MIDREKTMKETAKNTPKTFSVNDLINLDDDNEDSLIYERRCYESERRIK